MTGITRPRPTAGPGNTGSRLLAALARAVAAAAALALLACVSGLGSSAAAAAVPAAAGTGPLTCFAVDVSGSNLVAAGGEPPSDPGPVFVRQQVVELFREVLADLGQASGQQVGVVTFGTGPGARIGPLAVSAPAARATLATALPGALRPSSAEAAWTDWVAGVNGCEQMFKRAGDPRGMVVLLTDGFPQGPAGNPAAQLAAIAPMARQLWAAGITIQPVLYGAAVGQPGPARQDMTQLAALGHGHLTLAATPLDMLSAALSLASLSTGLPLGGSGFPVNGSTTVPLDVAPRVAAAVLVVLRSSSRLQISVDAPGGKTLASEGASTPGLGLVVPLTDPGPGGYQARADGQGSAFAAELLRYAAVAATPPSPSATAAPHRTGPGQARTGSGQNRSGSRSDAWLLGATLALVALALAGLIGWRATARRRPAGSLVAWRGSLSCLLDPADVNGLVPLEDLFHEGGEPAGWSVSWTRRAPVTFGPGGLVIQLAPGETRTLPTVPPATLTWFPDGTDTSLSDELPGRPVTVRPQL
jgi:hypothetical protein